MLSKSLPSHALDGLASVLLTMSDDESREDELLELTKQMEEAHDIAMGIWQELQAFRLDQ